MKIKRGFEDILICDYCVTKIWDYYTDTITFTCDICKRILCEDCCEKEPCPISRVTDRFTNKNYWCCGICLNKDILIDANLDYFAKKSKEEVKKNRYKQKEMNCKFTIMNIEFNNNIVK